PIRSSGADDPLDTRCRALEALLVEEVGPRVCDLMDGAVEVVRAGRSVQRIADRDLVADDERGPVPALEQTPIGVGVATRRVVEALAARERVAACVLPFPRAIVVDRPALEVANVDVVEKRLNLERDLASCERDRRGLARARKARVNADVEGQV